MGGGGTGGLVKFVGKDWMVWTTRTSHLQKEEVGHREGRAGEGWLLKPVGKDCEGVDNQNQTIFSFFSKHIVVGRSIVQHTSNTITTFIHTSFCL